jgi:hypothetical protein
LHHLRNAVAHLDVEFDGKNTGGITRLILQNKDEGTHTNVIWECRFPIENIKTFLTKLCDYVEHN